MIVTVLLISIEINVFLKSVDKLNHRIGRVTKRKKLEHWRGLLSYDLEHEKSMRANQEEKIKQGKLRKRNRLNDEKERKAMWE